jgi:hypothetical protein
MNPLESTFGSYRPLKTGKAERKKEKKVVCRSFHCSVSYINGSGVIVTKCLSLFREVWAPTNNGMEYTRGVAPLIPKMP